jgi:hypothetical protein
MDKDIGIFSELENNFKYKDIYKNCNNQNLDEKKYKPLSELNEPKVILKIIQNNKEKQVKEKKKNARNKSNNKYNKDKIQNNLIDNKKRKRAETPVKYIPTLEEKSKTEISHETEKRKDKEKLTCTNKNTSCTDLTEEKLEESNNNMNLLNQENNPVLEMEEDEKLGKDIINVLENTLYNEPNIEQLNQEDLDEPDHQTQLHIIKFAPNK